jgi:RES domain-containing protein
MTLVVPTSELNWKHSWRVIPTRYPELRLYGRVAPNEDDIALDDLQKLTNNRARQSRGEVKYLRDNDYFPKRCAEEIKAAFAHGSSGRFNTRRFRAYYTASALKTAAREKAYHHLTFLRDANYSATKAEMRAIQTKVEARVHDIRGRQRDYPSLYDPVNYEASQAWAFARWNEGSQGIVYDSVRDPEGQCAAIYSPQTISHCRKDRILIFEWDGEQTIRIDALQEFLTIKSAND